MAVDSVNVGGGRGGLSYSKSILLSIVTLATKEISGVAPFNNSKRGKLFGGGDAGAKVTNTKEGVVVDAFINVYDNCNVAEVACKVQENIKNNIIAMTEVPVKSINVHVLGVKFTKTTL